jgi:two-component sensor histidine kinase
MNGEIEETDLRDEGGSRARLADALIRFIAILGGLAYIPSAYLSWRERLWLILAVDTVAYLLFLALALVKTLPYRLKIASILSVFYLLGISLLLVTGPFGAGHIYIFCFVILTGLFGSTRLLVAANLLCAASYAGFAVFASVGHPAWNQGAASVVVISANAAMMGAVLSAAANYLVRRYAAAAAAERRLRLFRETMLREIDHRVKNNLQVLSSIISLRSRPEADPAEALRGIRESFSAIALVHQLLDREGAHYSLKVGRFLGALFSRFGSTYPDRTFDFLWKGPDIEVDSDVGIDLGVMINEIVVNSVKHAFVDGVGARIFLEASAEAKTRRLSLFVGDEGPGPALVPGPASGRGQGRKIIEALAKHLGAEMKVDLSRGFVYSLELDLPRLEEPEGQPPIRGAGPEGR